MRGVSDDSRFSVLSVLDRVEQCDDVFFSVCALRCQRNMACCMLIFNAYAFISYVAVSCLVAHAMSKHQVVYDCVGMPFECGASWDWARISI